MDLASTLDLLEDVLELFLDSPWDTLALSLVEFLSAVAELVSTLLVEDKDLVGRSEAIALD